MLRILAAILLFSSELALAQELKTIMPKEFVAQNPSIERKAIVKSITQQFEGKSVSQAQLDSLWNDSEAREALHLNRFQIINQKLYVAGVEETSPHFRSYIQYFQRLINQYKVQDVDFMIHILDELRHVGLNEPFIKKAKDIPIFMMSKDLNDLDESQKLILPEPFMLWDNYAELLRKIKRANASNLWENKIDKIYWRGSSTGNASLPYNLNNLAKLPRLKLAILSKLYPDIIDARFTYYFDEAFEEDKNGELRKILDLLFGENLEKIAEVDHLKYKYLISIDGNTCAWVRIPWIMYSNSVLIKQETKKVEWFYPALKPYVHYVPINENLTDIFKQFEWMKQHDEELKQISNNANNFVQNELSPEHIDAHMVIILNKYAEIQQDKKLSISLPSAEETRSFKGVSLAVIARIKRNFINWVKHL